MNVLYTTNTENTNFHQASGKLEAGIPFLYWCDRFYHHNYILYDIQMNITDNLCKQTKQLFLCKECLDHLHS
jgi:hypothetical protein